VGVNISLRSVASLSTPDQFKEIIVKQGLNDVVRLGQVAEVSLRAENEKTRLRVNGESMVALAIVAQPGSNQIEIADEIYRRLDQIQPDLAKDLILRPIIDNTRFVRSALNEVKNTIFIAFFLVVAVIFLF
jgi:multidrug efflux pump